MGQRARIQVLFNWCGCTVEEVDAKYNSQKTPFALAIREFGKYASPKDGANQSQSKEVEHSLSANGRGTGMSTTDESFCSEGVSKAASVIRGDRQGEIPRVYP